MSRFLHKDQDCANLIRIDVHEIFSWNPILNCIPFASIAILSHGRLTMVFQFKRNTNSRLIWLKLRIHSNLAMLTIIDFAKYPSHETFFSTSAVEDPE